MLYQGSTWFGQTQTYEVPSSGSGIIVGQNDTELLVVTNNHVIEGATTLAVTFIDESSVEAAVKGTDSASDLAVIAVPLEDISADTKSQIKAATLGDSDSLKMGQGVIAIGNALGLGQSVTVGHVSALNREVTVDGVTKTVIQTDAAINPGNSGGPLFNMKGEVIGINSQIFSTSGGFMGLSFAVPIDLALQIKDELVKHGKVNRGRLGVMIQTMSPELAKSFGLEKNKGALIAQIQKGSAAEKAGLQEGDIVILFDGKGIDNAADLSRAVASARPDTEHNVKVLREGKEAEVKVKLDAAADTSVAKGKAAEEARGRLGVTVRGLNDEEKKKYGDGLVVVESHGPASEAGIKEGDVLLSVGGKKIRSFEQFKDAVNAADKTLALQVARDGSRTFLAVKLDPKDKKEEKK